ncbi:MAG TPA: hypothetical protein ENH80_08690 [Phycisphaerae bacterium]|nr:hypothetical protein [Phycisphaerae bacterium]
MPLSIRITTLAVVSLLALAAGCAPTEATTPATSPAGDGDVASSPPEEPWQRELVSKCLPVAVDWRVLHLGKHGWYVGAGVLLHEAGYALVNAHVYLVPGAGAFRSAMTVGSSGGPVSNFTTHRSLSGE